MKNKNKKPIFPQKALISIFLPKEKVWITGEGMCTAVKNPEGEFVFETYMKKNYQS